MRLALDILEGQNLARKNHHRVGPRRAGASELPAVGEIFDRAVAIALRLVGTPTDRVGDGAVGCRLT
jgi:hypothetical protein